MLEITGNHFKPTLRTICEIVGLYNWSTLHAPRYDYYALFKWMRRRMTRTSNLDEEAHLWTSANAALQRWGKVLLQQDNVLRMDKPETNTVMITDASPTGFGAFVIPESGPILAWGGPFERRERIEVLEARAVCYGVHGLPMATRPDMHSTHELTIFVDNTTVMFNMKKQRSNCFLRNSILWRATAMAQHNGYTSVNVSHIPTQYNLADELSRRDWSLVKKQV